MHKHYQMLLQALLFWLEQTIYLIVFDFDESLVGFKGIHKELAFLIIFDRLFIFLLEYDVFLVIMIELL